MPQIYKLMPPKIIRKTPKSNKVKIEPSVVDYAPLIPSQLKVLMDLGDKNDKGYGLQTKRMPISTIRPFNNPSP